MFPECFQLLLNISTQTKHQTKARRCGRRFARGDHAGGRRTLRGLGFAVRFDLEGQVEMWDRVLLRKPAGRLGKVVFRERSEQRGCGGGSLTRWPGIHHRLVIRVSFLQLLEGHVPLGNFVTVGSDFPGFDSPQVP